MADGRWKKIRFSPNGHVVSVIQSDSSREEVILSPTLDLNKSHRELILSAPSHKAILHINRNDEGKLLAIDSAGDLYLGLLSSNQIQDLYFSNLMRDDNMF